MNAEPVPQCVRIFSFTRSIVMWRSSRISMNFILRFECVMCSSTVDSPCAWPPDSWLTHDLSDAMSSAAMANCAGVGAGRERSGARCSGAVGFCGVRGGRLASRNELDRARLLRRSTAAPTEELRRSDGSGIARSARN